MRLSAAGVASAPVLGSRLNRALLFSLLVHGLLLSLSFGQGLGLPGLDFPWQTRRGEAADDGEDPRTLRERLEQDDDDHYEPDYAPARGRVRTEPRI